jgi:phage protein D
VGDLPHLFVTLGKEQQRQKGIIVADSVNVTNFPDSGSPERVALDLMKFLKNLKPESRQEWLDFYAECLDATRGRRRRN